MVTFEFGISPAKDCTGASRVFEAPEEHDELESLGFSSTLSPPVERDRRALDRVSELTLFRLERYSEFGHLEEQLVA